MKTGKKTLKRKLNSKKIVKEIQNEKEKHDSESEEAEVILFILHL